jgi:hypothetical protein
MVVMDWLLSLAFAAIIQLKLYIQTIPNNGYLLLNALHHSEIQELFPARWTFTLHAL